MVAGVRQVLRVPRVENSTGESERGTRKLSKRGASWALANARLADRWDRDWSTTYMHHRPSHAGPVPEGEAPGP